MYSLPISPKPTGQEHSTSGVHCCSLEEMDNSLLL